MGKKWRRGVRVVRAVEGIATHSTQWPVSPRPSIAVHLTRMETRMLPSLTRVHWNLPHFYPFFMEVLCVPWSLASHFPRVSITLETRVLIHTFILEICTWPYHPFSTSLLTTGLKHLIRHLCPRLSFPATQQCKQGTGVVSSQRSGFFVMSKVTCRLRTVNTGQ